MDSTLRELVDLRDRVLQKNRIAFSNRLSALELDRDEYDDETVELIERWHSRFLELEKEVEKDIRSIAEDIPIIQHMVEVKGISFILAAKVVSMIDIQRAPTISALWRYAGFAVINGERERPIKGEKLHYNKRLKSTCYVVASSFMKASSPYRKIYDQAREYYDEKKPDWTDLHKHRAASRKMIKIWLSHLWVRWRDLEGLSITEPYILSDPKHSQYISGKEFGWSEALGEYVIK